MKSEKNGRVEEEKLNIEHGNRKKEKGGNIEREEGVESEVGKVGAFFDVDYVVVGKDLYRLLGEELIRRGIVPKFRVFVWYIWLIRYRLNILKGEDILRQNIKETKGISVEEFKKIAEAVFISAKNYILPKAVELIKSHIQQGHEVAFLSGNFKYLIEPIAEYIGVPKENVIAVEFVSKDGVFTGEVVEPICIGRGKTYWMRKFARERGIDLSRSYFYTDSFYDFDTLLSVGFPVAVNPDPRLKAFARKLGWPIIYTKK